MERSSQCRRRTRGNVASAPCGPWSSTAMSIRLSTRRSGRSQRSSEIPRGRRCTSGFAGVGPEPPLGRRAKVYGCLVRDRLRRVRRHYSRAIVGCSAASHRRDYQQGSSSLPMIGRRSPASSSFVLGPAPFRAPGLRALQLDPYRATARNRQLRGKPEQQSPPSPRSQQVTGPVHYALLTTDTPIGGVLRFRLGGLVVTG